MEPGQILANRYEVRRAWRRVYLLLDLSSGRYVSARPTDALACPQAIAQLRALVHPCLPRVFGEVEAEGKCLTLFEYIPGVDLATHMRRASGALAASMVCAIGAALAYTLSFLHEQLERPLVHLDIKPSHVILADGVPCLIDFGSAVLLERSSTAQAGTAPAAPDEGRVREATPAYAAPETAVWHGPCIQSDLYSLGVTLFSALGGQAPPRGCLPDLRDLPPTIPDQVRNAIGRCLMADPAARYASMGALAHDLRLAMRADLCSVDRI